MTVVPSRAVLRIASAVALFGIAGSAGAQAVDDAKSPKGDVNGAASPRIPRRIAITPTTAHTMADTTRRRTVVLSDAYGTRLQVHRYTAYAIIPLFAYQWIVGQQLWDGVTGDEPPADWVRPAHRAGAVAIGAAFGVNTVTGAMNLWETRAQPEGRITRLLHAATMTTALAGFTYAGIELSEEAKESADKRRQHRNVALGSMALTLASGTAMWIVNR